MSDVLKTNTGKQIELTELDYPLTITIDKRNFIYVTEKFKSGKIATQRVSTTDALQYKTVTSI